MIQRVMMISSPSAQPAADIGKTVRAQPVVIGWLVAPWRAVGGEWWAAPDYDEHYVYPLRAIIL